MSILCLRSYISIGRTFALSVFSLVREAWSTRAAVIQNTEAQRLEHCPDCHLAHINLRKGTTYSMPSHLIYVHVGSGAIQLWHCLFAPLFVEAWNRANRIIFGRRMLNHFIGYFRKPRLECHSWPYLFVQKAEWSSLKRPKCEIFGFGFFALIRPIWIGDLGTRPKNY